MKLSRTPYFIQVGAFDGVSGDLLFPYTKRGLLKGCLIEPQEDAFEKLSVNYANIAGVRLKRAAIAAETGTATLYRVRPGTAGPPWLHQIASFRKDVLLKSATEIPGLEEAVITETVPTVTFTEVIAELGAEPDILAIDTEGFDFEVIKLLNLSLHKPHIIVYEHKHLSFEDQNACVKMLGDAGYLIAISEPDTIAYLNADLTL